VFGPFSLSLSLCGQTKHLYQLGMLLTGAMYVEAVISVWGAMAYPTAPPHAMLSPHLLSIQIAP